ncbi:hypothetical protein L1987_13333 [Smallanthus sonchifolius]|uniref:Uncharacterized protein n=1 Tax=Smallanthus sonchifolius TaxID=185202 RepID=A0ACB9JGN1_9ASTR|nr:hypothetical protein L1987_13333 [Smallanthus sonchifolius]
MATSCAKEEELEAAIALEVDRKKKRKKTTTVLTRARAQPLGCCTQIEKKASNRKGGPLVQSSAHIEENKNERQKSFSLGQKATRVSIENLLIDLQQEKLKQVSKRQQESKMGSIFESR